MKRLILSILLGLLLSTPALAERHFVEKVEDGQTLKLITGERVKLIGVDINGDQSQEASDFVRSLVSGSIIELEYDELTRDENGYILAYAWFEYEINYENPEDLFPDNFDLHYVKPVGAQTGKFYVMLNSTIIKAGYAKPAFLDSNMKHAQLMNNMYREKDLLTAAVSLE